jgi:hypothetical protein
MFQTTWRVDAAKSAETRQRRIGKTITLFRDGRQR